MIEEKKRKTVFRYFSESKKEALGHTSVDDVLDVCECDGGVFTQEEGVGSSDDPEDYTQTVDSEGRPRFLKTRREFRWGKG